jgi:hypothetical protein
VGAPRHDGIGAQRSARVGHAYPHVRAGFWRIGAGRSVAAHTATTSETDRSPPPPAGILGAGVAGPFWAGHSPFARHLPSRAAGGRQRGALGMTIHSTR